MGKNIKNYIQENGFTSIVGKSFINPNCQDKSGVFIVGIRQDNRVEYYGIASIYAKPLATSIMDKAEFIEMFWNYKFSDILD